MPASSSIDFMQSSMQPSQDCNFSRVMARFVKNFGFEGSFWILMRSVRENWRCYITGGDKRTLLYRISQLPCSSLLGSIWGVSVSGKRFKIVRWLPVALLFEEIRFGHSDVGPKGSWISWTKPTKHWYYRLFSLSSGVETFLWVMRGLDSGGTEFFPSRSGSCVAWSTRIQARSYQHKSIMLKGACGWETRDRRLNNHPCIFL